MSQKDKKPVAPQGYAPQPQGRAADMFRALEPAVPAASPLAELLDDPALQSIDGKRSAYLPLEETLYNPQLRAKQFATLAQVKAYYPEWHEGNYGLYAQKVGEEPAPLGASSRQPIAVLLLSLVNPDGKVEMYAMRSGGNGGPDGKNNNALPGLDEALIAKDARINASYGIQNSSLDPYSARAYPSMKGNAYATADGRIGFLRLISDDTQTGRGRTEKEIEKGIRGAFGIHADGGSTGANRGAGGRYDGNHGCVSGLDDAEQLRFFTDYTAIPLEQRPSTLYVLANNGVQHRFAQRSIVPPKQWNEAHEQVKLSAPSPLQAPDAMPATIPNAFRAGYEMEMQLKSLDPGAPITLDGGLDKQELMAIGKVLGVSDADAASRPLEYLMNRMQTKIDGQKR